MGVWVDKNVIVIVEIEGWVGWHRETITLFTSKQPMGQPMCTVVKRWREGVGGHKNCRAQLRAPCTHTKQAANSWADDPSIPEEEKSRHGTSLVHICANICIFKNKMGSVILHYILYDHTTKTTIITTTTTTTPPLDNQATNHHDRDDYDHWPSSPRRPLWLWPTPRPSWSRQQYRFHHHCTIFKKESNTMNWYLPNPTMAARHCHKNTTRGGQRKKA